MIKVQGIAALCGLVFVVACKAPDTTSRMDSTTFAGPLAPVAMSATRDLREPSQSLAVVAMKDSLAPGETLQISDRARAIITAYAD